MSTVKTIHNTGKIMLTLEIEQKPELLKLIQQGEEIMILEHNVPIAKITPLPQKIKRKLGSATGLFTMSDDFNNPLSDFDEYQ
jgi:antitoxin (DNA-binding transcriptional repressor) of toxin-antitoxin stability system